MRPLRTYALLNNLATSLINPFISFFSASNGIIGPFLALVSSANTAFPGIMQYILANLSIRAKRMIIIGDLLSGILWITIGALGIYNSMFVLIYVIIAALLGVANFGWLLILDKVSGTKRGTTLAYYNFYAYIGGLVATLITGLIVKDDLSLMDYFFIIGGIIYIINCFVISRLDVDVKFIKSKTSVKNLILNNSEMRKFILASFIFTLIWSMAWPIFPLAQVYKFHMNEFQIAIINLTGGLSTVALQRLVGRLVDKHRRRVMFFERFALATFPLAYALSTYTYQIYLANLVSGFTNSASISYTAYLFDNSNYYEKRANIALYNMFNGFAALIGSTLSSVFFEILSSHLSLVFSIDLMLLMIGILRILASLLFLTVRDRSKAENSNIINKY
ncbi:MFS transporter [Sulfolobus sp. A20-N-F8]|nr:MFS transporter [Sulfolobus sp. A20-N-F8]